MSKAWKRYRFKANPDDPRPIIFPPPGPYWITGGGDDFAIVVAYLPRHERLRKYWPEASQAEFTLERGISYSERFQKPEWFKA